MLKFRSRRASALRLGRVAVISNLSIFGARRPPRIYLPLYARSVRKCRDHFDLHTHRNPRSPHISGHSRTSLTWFPKVACAASGFDAEDVLLRILTMDRLFTDYLKRGVLLSIK